jgi:hypothetical protein
VPNLVPNPDELDGRDERSTVPTVFPRDLLNAQVFGPTSWYRITELYSKERYRAGKWSDRPTATMHKKQNNNAYAEHLQVTHVGGFLGATPRAFRVVVRNPGNANAQCKISVEVPEEARSYN